MAYFEMTGGKKLYGEVFVQGSKNAVLPIMAASLLTKETVILKGCPLISDLDNLRRIMEDLGADILQDGHDYIINSENLKSYSVLGDNVGKLRSSVLLLGSLMGRMHRAVFSAPGGCAIGKRPIDLHLYAMEQLNCRTTSCEGIFCCQTGRLTGNEVKFSYPSVGATENAVMAAVLAKGTTVINGAAKEPEVLALCDFLNVIGADIRGAGTDEIVINGAAALNGGSYTLPKDRIVTGTYLAAGALLGGDIKIKTDCTSQLDAAVDILNKMGAKVSKNDKGFHIISDGKLKSPGELVTGPYPGFPTDLQSIFLPLMLSARGESCIKETVFESRYNTAAQLRKMGAEIEKEGKYLKIKGDASLAGAKITAPDLRGGAALILAGLFADGKTRVLAGENIKRGYEDIAGDLKGLGAKIIYVS